MGDVNAMASKGDRGCRQTLGAYGRRDLESQLIVLHWRLRHLYTLIPRWADSPPPPSGFRWLRGKISAVVSRGFLAVPPWDSNLGGCFMALVTLLLIREKGGWCGLFPGEAFLRPIA